MADRGWRHALKNLAVLRIAAPGSSTFASARLAPLYDAVSTRVFPRLADRLALKLNGREDRLGLDDFVAAAKTMGLPGAAAKRACQQLADRLTDRAATLQLPPFAQSASGMLQALVSIVQSRCGSLRAATS